MIDKGLLESTRLTTTQRDALSLGASDTAVIYNTTTTQYEVWTGSAWQPMLTNVTHATATTTTGDPTVVNGGTVDIPPPIAVSRRNGSTVKTLAAGAFIDINDFTVSDVNTGNNSTLRLSTTYPTGRILPVHLGMYRFSVYHRWESSGVAQKVGIGFVWDATIVFGPDIFEIQPTGGNLSNPTGQRQSVSYPYPVTGSRNIGFRLYNLSATTVSYRDTTFTMELIRV